MVEADVLRQSSLKDLSKTRDQNSSVSLKLLPEAVKVIFRGCPASVHLASMTFEVSLPLDPCQFRTERNRTTYWLGPDEWLLRERGNPANDLFARMSRAFPEPVCSLVDVSHRSDAFRFRVISVPTS